MKPNFEALHQHYEIRENRYKEQISSLQEVVETQSKQISDLEKQLQLANNTIKRLNEQVSRLTMYGNCDTHSNSNKQIKKHFPFFWKNK